MTIHWEEIWSPRWPSELAMWDELYVRSDAGCSPVGDYLGVSNMSVSKRLDDLGIQKKPPGGANSCGLNPKKKTYQIVHSDVSHLDTRQIAERFGMTMNGAREICRKHKVPHVALRRGRPPRKSDEKGL